jgi:very-short-patch-repair endonuclease
VAYFEERPEDFSEGDLTAFKPFSACLGDALDSLSIACSLESRCESPIEIDLATRVTKALRVIGDDTLSLVPQYVLGPYRYDFAIVRGGRTNPVVLVECDGKEFHSTPEQLLNDTAKNRLAKARGTILLRFAGAEIYREPGLCVAKMLKTMRFQGHLTQQQCDLLDAAGIKRH